MQLSSPSTDLKELQKQNDMFIKLKADYDKSVKELTKGQDINQLEVRARRMLEEAKREAGTIVANAKRGVDQVEKSKCDYAALKAKLEESKVIIDNAKQAALKAKSEAEQEKQQALTLKADLQSKCDACDKAKTEMKAKMEELKSLLANFSASIN